MFISLISRGLAQDQLRDHETSEGPTMCRQVSVTQGSHEYIVGDFIMRFSTWLLAGREGGTTPCIELLLILAI